MCSPGAKSNKGRERAHHAGSPRPRKNSCWGIKEKPTLNFTTSLLHHPSYCTDNQLGPRSSAASRPEPSSGPIAGICPTEETNALGVCASGNQKGNQLLGSTCHCLDAPIFKIEDCLMIASTCIMTVWLLLPWGVTRHDTACRLRQPEDCPPGLAHGDPLPEITPLVSTETRSSSRGFRIRALLGDLGDLRAEAAKINMSGQRKKPSCQKNPPAARLPQLHCPAARHKLADRSAMWSVSF